MSVRVTLDLSAELAARARAAAIATNRRFEEVLVGWAARGAAHAAAEQSSDGELLAMCEASLPAEAQRELSELLVRNRESRLDASQRRRLDKLMANYRQRLVQKAKAWQQAVARGLMPPLSDHLA